MRYDYHTTFGGITKPRFGLIYNPDSKTALKLLYGEAFRAPNNFEFYYDTGQFTRNPNLRPEKVKTTELVLERYVGESFRMSASGYFYRINGLINQVTDPITGLISFRNIDKVESKGLEFEIESKLSRWLEGRIGYTLHDTQNLQNKQTLTNSPRHLGKLNLNVPLFKKKLFAGLDLQYTSKRRTLDGTEAQAFWLPNITIFGRQLLKGMDLSFSVYNLFDQKYGDPGAEEHLQKIIIQNGRDFRLKLNYRF
jgi:iron complex outermembrane receptor protein